MTPRAGKPPGSALELAAATVAALRPLVVAAWIAAAVLALTLLPKPGEAGGGALGSLVPRGSSAVETQKRSARLFAFPILSNTAVVQRDPQGLGAAVQARAVERARRVLAREYPDLLSVAFALPVLNTLGAFPGAAETNTTAITYLYFRPGVGLLDRDKLARWFTDRRLREDDALVGTTGVVPARVEQGRLITDALPLVEIATVVLIALVIGITFRSLAAPLFTLVTVAVAYGVALGTVGAVGAATGMGVPREIEPILLVLLLGLVTDYCIFFLSGVRSRLRAGDDRLEASRRTTVEFAPIIATAGVIVAAGAASLLVARLEFFRAFGPALALTVLVALAVSLTFVPAWIALLGRAAYWPGSLRPGGQQPRVELVARVARSRGLASAVVVVTVALLGAAAAELRHADLLLTPIRSLPSGSEPAEAADAAEAGFAPGIVAPTLVLVESPQLRRSPAALAAVQRRIERLPGVAGVIGPRNLPRRTPAGVVRSRDGTAARFVLVLEEQPLGSEAMALVRDLPGSLRRAVDDAGLPGARISIGGNTAIAVETVDAIVDDLVRIAFAVLAVNLVLLMLFLRSLVAPLYLLAASALAVAAALGATTFVFEGLLGEQTTYYVPFMVAVLLVSLGSDYNVFLVGRIWHEARQRPLGDAVAVAAPRASHPIGVAALALALSFALLVLVPLGAFRQFAFAMAVGVLVDAFLVRSFLVPALVVLVGRAGGWPGRFATRPVVDDVAV